MKEAKYKRLCILHDTIFYDILEKEKLYEQK